MSEGYVFMGIDWGSSGGDYTLILPGRAWFLIAILSERRSFLLGLN